MSINVVFTGPIKATTGMVTTTSNARSVEELIEELSTRFGEGFRLEARKTKIIVNGYAVQFYDGLRTRLKPGDTVDFLQNWRILEKQAEPDQ